METLFSDVLYQLSYLGTQAILGSPPSQSRQSHDDARQSAVTRLGRLRTAERYEGGGVTENVGVVSRLLPSSGERLNAARATRLLPQ